MIVLHVVIGETNLEARQRMTRYPPPPFNRGASPGLPFPSLPCLVQGPVVSVRLRPVQGRLQRRQGVGFPPKRSAQGAYVGVNEKSEASLAVAV